MKSESVDVQNKGRWFVMSSHSLGLAVKIRELSSIHLSNIYRIYYHFCKDKKKIPIFSSSLGIYNLGLRWSK